MTTSHTEGKPSTRQATATRRLKKPDFVEPNLDVLQVKSVLDYSPLAWLDYASIKTPEDMREAIARVDGMPQGYRIVRKHMGTYVIYAR